MYYNKEHISEFYSFKEYLSVLVGKYDVDHIRNFCLMKFMVVLLLRILFVTNVVIEGGLVNPSNAEATFVQSSRAQRFLKII